MLITNQELFRTIEHWLHSPENGYLGSGYGGKDAALAAPQGEVSANTCKIFMDKLFADVPSLAGRDISITKSMLELTFSIDQHSETYFLQDYAEHA